MISIRSTIGRFALPAVALLIAGPAVAQTKDHAPVALPSARMMAQDKANTESWTYAQPTSVFTKYRTVIVDPTTVYQGPDAQFDGVDPADRQKYAAVITDELRQRSPRLSRARQAASGHAAAPRDDPRRDQDRRAASQRRRA